ncbi:MAG: tetratricopeptide repeat protein [Verrucomicrobia bacterium]|nr:tetratricopeptide repeat protein [Verrucomicrobiota bacterium]
MAAPPQCRGWGGGLLRLFLAVQVTLAGGAAVPLGGQERLQQLTRLPRFSFNFGLSFRGTEGFELTVGTPDPTRELTALREALTGQTDDAPRFVRLGRVLDGLNEMAMAQRAYARAVELYERQGAADSREIAVLVGYADALRGQNQFAAAERLLRRAVEIAPEDWQPRPALARLLGLTAIHALASLEGKPAGIDWAQLLSDPAAVRLNAAGVEEAERRLAEAVQEAERGVKLGPQQADTFLARANVGTARRLASALRALTEAPEDEPAARIWAVNRAIFHRDALPDLWAAARLSPEQPAGLGLRGPA